MNSNIIVLDIGRRDCNIAEYSKRGKEIVLIHKDVFTPMNYYISDDGKKLVNIEGFASDIIKFFGISGFTGKSVVLCGSLLGINATLQNWQYEDKKELPKKFADQVNGEQARLINKFSWQYFGTKIKENSTEACINYAYMSNDASMAYTTAFNCRGYTIKGFIDEATAIFSLARLSVDTYERPSRFIMDLGNTITCYTVIKNIPIDKFALQAGFGSLVEGIVKELNVSTDEANYILFNVGFLDDCVTAGILNQFSIDVDKYFEVMIKFARKLVNDMQLQLEAKATAYKIGRYRIMLIGGYSTIPGIANAFREVLKCESIELTELISSSYEYQDGFIKSEQGKSLTPPYLQTLGCMLYTNFKWPLNLISSQNTVVDLTKPVKIVPRVLAVVSAVCLMSCGWGYYSTTTRLKELEQYNDKILAVQSTIDQYAKGIEMLNNSLAVMGSLTDLEQRLIEFTKDFKNSKLMVASIDSINILESAEVGTGSGVEIGVDEGADGSEVGSAEGSKVAMEGGSEVAADGSGVSADSSTDAGLKSLSKYLNESKEYVIRGYSQDYNTVIEYFDKLKEQEPVKDLTLSGITKGTLPSGEAIFLFQMVAMG